MFMTECCLLCNAAILYNRRNQKTKTAELWVETPSNPRGRLCARTIGPEIDNIRAS
jgi:hypothetical protein